MLLHMVDPPPPFAPTKELQDFMAQYGGTPDLAPGVRASLQIIQQELARRAREGDSSNG